MKRRNRQSVSLKKGLLFDAILNHTKDVARWPNRHLALQLLAQFSRYIFPFIGHGTNALDEIPARGRVCKWLHEGMVGQPMREATLLRVSAQLERARPWAGRHPEVW